MSDDRFIPAGLLARKDKVKVKQADRRTGRQTEMQTQTDRPKLCVSTVINTDTAKSSEVEQGDCSNHNKDTSLDGDVKLLWTDARHSGY